MGSKIFNAYATEYKVINLWGFDLPFYKAP